MKLHARVRGQAPPNEPLYVGNDDHWQLMRSAAKPVLICAEDGCDCRVTPVERGDTRFLRFVSDTRHCEHGEIAPHEYAAPTAKRRWMINRVAAMCRKAGYSVREEDWPTRSDVLIPESQVAIQISLSGTDFDQRTARKREMGLSVIWFIDEDATGRKINDAMFNQPAVRFRVFDSKKRRNESDRRIQPWHDAALNRYALVEVFGTVVVDAPGFGRRPTRTMSALDFLREVLSGERVWVAPSHANAPLSVIGKRQGAWLPRELISVRHPVVESQATDLQGLVSELAARVVAVWDANGAPTSVVAVRRILLTPFGADLEELRGHALTSQSRDTLLKRAKEHSTRLKDRQRVDALPAEAPLAALANATLDLLDVAHEVRANINTPALNKVTAAANQLLADCLKPDFGRSGGEVTGPLT